jgi:hypothetical protein
VSGYREVHAAIRLTNGHTLLVGQTDKGVTIHEVDREGKETGRIVVEGKRSSRNAQRLENGNILFTSGKSAIEVDGSGKIVWEAALPGSADDVDRLENGLTVVPDERGRHRALSRQGGEGRRTRGGKEAHPDLKINWFAATQTLPNGNWSSRTGSDTSRGSPAPRPRVRRRQQARVEVGGASRVQTLHNVLVLE